MVFKKKKYYFCVVLILVLLIVAVVVPTTVIPSISNGSLIEAEGEAPQPEDEFQDQTNQEFQPETNLGAGGSSVGDNVQEVEELNLTFSNAWVAFNYAMKKNNELKSYVSFNQAVNAKTKILGVDVDVNANVNRRVYNNVSEVYVLTDTKTEFDVGNLGIDLSMYEGFNACTMFDIAGDFVQDASGWGHSLTEYYEKNGITVYEIPYLINRETATIMGGLVNNPNASYYEINMKLKPKSWEAYQKALRNVIQVEKYPTVEEVVVKIKIDKKYGTFQSIEAVERFTFEYPYAGATFKLTANGKINMKFNYQVDISDKVKELRSRVYP